MVVKIYKIYTVVIKNCLGKKSYNKIRTYYVWKFKILAKKIIYS